jgi:glycosyltransferase involved in cell wall biosynthesis
LGGEEEDPEYAYECRSFAGSLGILHTQVQFLGHQRVDHFYPKVGLVALSSISEGQPLVILEAFAAGVPVVATDVGACRELIEGREASDRELGTAGRVVPLANPEALATAMLALLGDVECWRSAQAVALERVTRYYDSHVMENRYRELYARLMDSSTEPVIQRG